MTSEPASENPLVNRAVAQWAIVVVAVALVFYLLSSFLEGGFFNFMIPAIPVALFAWMILARGAWWVLLPFALSFGGLFYFGFKVYTHEVGLALCFLPLLPMLAVRRTWKVERAPLPRSAYFLLAYFVVHMAVSLYLCRMEGLAGAGNLVRVYMRGLWPLIFLVPFYAVGSTQYLRGALVAMYVGALFRVSLGVAGVYWPQLLYVPLINFVLPGTYTSGIELRESALFLVPICLCFASIARSRILRVVHVLVAVGAGVGIMLGGGRASMGVLCACDATVEPPATSTIIPP